MLYCFHHYDGVVHHQADGQDHGKHGQGIDGKAQQYESAKSTDQGNGNRQHGNQSSPHITQENINYDQHQDQSFKKGMGNLLQRFLDELGLIHGNDQFHIRREAGLRIFQYFPDLRYGIDGIGIGSQGYRVND